MRSKTYWPDTDTQGRLQSKHSTIIQGGNVVDTLIKTLKKFLDQIPLKVKN